MYIDDDAYDVLCRSKINNVIFATLMLGLAIIFFGASIMSLWILSATNQLAYDLPIFLIVEAIFFYTLLSIFFTIASITSYIEAYKLRKKVKKLFNL